MAVGRYLTWLWLILCWRKFWEVVIYNHCLIFLSFLASVLSFLHSLQCNHFARVCLEFETLLAPSPVLFWGKMSEITLNVFSAEVNRAFFMQLDGPAGGPCIGPVWVRSESQSCLGTFLLLKTINLVACCSQCAEFSVCCFGQVKDSVLKLQNLALITNISFGFP